MRPLVLAALCLTVAGCGADPAPEAQPAAPAVAVAMHGNRFAPHDVVVHLGQTVRWTNHDAVAHTVASQRLRLASEAVPGGATFSYRPRRRGRFAYYCTIHAGQTGVLVVR